MIKIFKKKNATKKNPNKTPKHVYYLQLIYTYVSSGPQREILQGGTRLLWGPRDRLRLLSKLRI